MLRAILTAQREFLSSTNVKPLSYISRDFIFGQRQRAWFDGVDIRVKANGWVTANGRDSDSNVSYYILNKW